MYSDWIILESNLPLPMQQKNTKHYDSKIYFKAKISKDWDPYFIGKTIMANTATRKDIASVVNKLVSNKYIANQLISELVSFIAPTSHQIRLTGQPNLFKECIGPEDYKKFVNWCKKMSLSTIDFTGTDWVTKEQIISMFSLYSYYNKPDHLED